jgi:Flp pilus assembly protein TadD
MSEQPKKRRAPRQTAEEDFLTLVQEGTQALQRGQTVTAIKLLEQARQLDSNHPDATLNLAGAYILSKKFKQAVDLLEPLSEQEPDNPMVWTNLGAAYLGNPVLVRDEEQYKAIAAFKQALNLDPATPNVAYNLGLIYVDRADPEQARHWFRRAIQANPQDRDARFYLKKLTETDTQADENR